MRIRHIILSSLLVLIPLVGLAVQKIDSVTRDSQVNVTVTRFEDHISIQCAPLNAETSSQPHWKAICNEMAISQVNKLVADGAIRPISGPVYDTEHVEEATSQLSRSFPLSHR